MGLLCCLTGRQLLAGHCLRWVFGEPAPPPPDGDLPMGARTSRLLPAQPGQVASGVGSCRPPFISGQGLAFRHLLPSRLGAKRAWAGLMCQTWSLCLHVLWLEGWGWRCPRWAVGAKAAPHPMHPTHPAPSSLAQCGLSWDGPRQSFSLETMAPCTFPAKLPIALRSCNQREQQELGCRQEVRVSAGGEGVLLGQAWSAVCVCLACVCMCQHMHVLRSKSICGEIHTYIHIHTYMHL